MRLLASLGHYLATTSAAGLQIHQFVSASVESTAGGAPVRLAMQSSFPWSGEVTVQVEETGEAPWTLALRRPGWCRTATLRLNGAVEPATPSSAGYFEITRRWAAGDRVELVLEMAPRLVAPHPRIDALRGCVALERGPLVYCFEQRDQAPGLPLDDALVDVGAPLQAEEAPDLLGGITTLHVGGKLFDTTAWSATLYAPVESLPPAAGREATLTAIPYFAWGNRGIGTMRIWMPRA
jgi:DUF1680 family protein